jgi:hypothetical protein
MSRAEPLPASTGRAVVRTPTVGPSVATSFTLLSRRPISNIPFLAQDLAQDTDWQQSGRQPGPERWRQREIAYRSAASPAQRPGINIEI